MKISIIVAVADNQIIGDENRLIWHISEDLRHFKSLTQGHCVVMGRKTYESLGRPLPNRENIVITRQDIEFEGCRVAHSLSEAVEISSEKEEIFIIGGAEIYAQALPIADMFYLTRVHHDYHGDTKFPDWSADEWEVVESRSYPRGEKYEYPFTIETLKRKRVV
ncbi:MAG: dihydrofolate reductase [Rikenellaceae bacterium]